MKEASMLIGRIGQEFLVNVTTAGNQYNPSAATLTDGRFVVTWYSTDGGDGSGTCIRYRIFSADGTPSSANDILLNTTAANDQYAPSVAALPGGVFVTAWESTDLAGSETDIRFRIISPPPMRNGFDLLVNTTTESFQQMPSIAALSDGGFVIVFTSVDPGVGNNIRARIYNADHTSAGNDFILSPISDDVKISPSIAGLSDGRFVVSWHSTDPGDGSEGCIRARIFNTGSTPAGNDFIVNTTGADEQRNGSITALAGGRFVITWDSFDTDGVGPPGDVRARVFNADGSPAGDDFLVNTTPMTENFNTYDASTVTLADGRFVIVWGSLDPGDGSAGCVRARLFSATGSPIGDDFIVNTVTLSGQDFPSVTALPDGRFVVTWKSFDTLVDNNIHAQIFDPTTFTGTAAAETWEGGSFGDQISGGGGSDTLKGGLGNDVIDGGAGIDNAVFNGARSAYTITDLANEVQVAGPDGTDTVTRIERLVFSDTSVSKGTSDFSGDFQGDLLWRHNDGTTFAWLMNNGQRATDIDLSKIPITFHVQDTGDFNGDGNADILWRHDDGTTLAWLMVDGQRNTDVDYHQIPNTFHVRGTGDFDGDGDGDLLWQHDDGTTLAWLMQDGQRVQDVSLGLVSSRWHVQGFGDFDGDRDSDILWRNDDGTTFIWLMKSGGTNYDGSNLGVIPTSFHVQATGDFDGDGDTDILWRHDDGTTLAWLMQSGHRVQDVSYGTIPNTFHVQGTADINGSGTSDIIWRHDDGTTLAWLMVNGQRSSDLSLGNIPTNWTIQTHHFDIV
jgi:hypothetical protein